MGGTYTVRANAPATITLKFWTDSTKTTAKPWTDVDSSWLAELRPRGNPAYTNPSATFSIDTSQAAAGVLTLSLTKDQVNTLIGGHPSASFGWDLYGVTNDTPVLQDMTLVIQGSYTHPSGSAAPSATTPVGSFDVVYGGTVTSNAVVLDVLKGDKGDPGQPGTSSTAINDSTVSTSTTYSSSKAVSTFAPISGSPNYSSKVGGVYHLTDYITGQPDLTGGTDYTSQLNAAISAACSASGGVIQFPAGTVKITSGGIVFPNDGATPVSGQKTIVLRGTGKLGIGNYNTPDAGSIINFTGSNTVGHIDTRGMGFLAVEDLTLETDDTTGTPFIQTTNTVIDVNRVTFRGPASLTGTACITDAVVMGGTGPNNTFDMTSAARFEGYGSQVRNCHFDRIRRGVLMQAACNSQVVRDNYWHSTCGGSAALEIHSYDNNSTGNVIIGNLFEVQSYVHAVVLYNTPANYFFGNSYWDYSRTNYMTSAIDLQGTAATSTNNVFLDFFQGIPVAKQITDSAGGNQWKSLDASVWRGVNRFDSAGNGFLIQPSAATGSETAQLFQVMRSGAESVSPNLKAFYVQQNGLVHAEGTQGKFLAVNGSQSVSFEFDGVVQQGTGNLGLYAGTGTTDHVQIMRGGFMLAKFATASRPTGVGEGFTIWDSTLHKPIYYNGTNWIDGTGATV